MRKLLLVMMLAVLVPAVLVPVVGFADERGPGKDRMKIFEALNLNKDQIEKVKKLHQETRKNTVKLRSDMELKRIDFEEELQKAKPDNNALMKLIGEMAELEAKQYRIRLETRVKMMEILTPEQKEKLIERISERRVSEERMSESIPPGRGDHPDDGFSDKQHHRRSRGGWGGF